MAQTLVSLLTHVVFSTKSREALITPEIEPELYAYIGGIMKNHDSRLLDAGGTADHVHLLLSQSKNIALSIDDPWALPTAIESVRFADEEMSVSNPALD